MSHSKEKEKLITFILIMDGKYVKKPQSLWRKILNEIGFLLFLIPIAFFLFIEPNIYKFILVFMCFWGGVKCAEHIFQTRSYEEWPLFSGYLDRSKIEDRLRQIEMNEKNT
ncbi:MAG: hypothetical protein B7Y40_00795 [Gammaproteobacteria bacterium 28-57-27]|nr:MAG: hypothetical protein B7Y40_00795 [Gammaproteobacteria bacterium 28-57-27]